MHDSTIFDSFTATLTHLIRSRRSIDLFEPEPVGTGLLREAIDLARWAPNHRLTEPWKFYIVGEATRTAIAHAAAEYETETKGERAGAARLKRLLDVPAYFVATSRRGTDELTDREDYAATCCAVQNLMLFLWHEGVGVKWTTGAITRQPRFYEILGIDAERETVVGFFWYGRAKVVPEKTRRDVRDIVVECE
jgi:nitroreductase